MNGMSSSGTILEITPLLPWRPASLSPSAILRFLATKTLTISLTPGWSSSPPSRLKRLTSITTPPSPWGTFSEESLTSRAFSPKIARKSFSSGVGSDSPLGVTLPTSTSPEPTSAPIRMMPSTSRFIRTSSEAFGMSRVISSGPSLVSLACTSYSSMCMDERVSSLTIRSEMIMASSKLNPSHGIKATSRFLPRASSPWSVEDPSAIMVPASTFSPSLTRGRWLTQVPWLERANFLK